MLLNTCCHLRIEKWLTTLGVPTLKKFPLIWLGSNIFSREFQKCKFYQHRIPLVHPQFQPMQPTYRLCYRLLGQSWCVEGVCLIKKIKKGTFVRVEKLSFWKSPVKIRNVAGTPTTKCNQPIYIKWNFWKVVKRYILFVCKTKMILQI